MLVELVQAGAMLAVVAAVAVGITALAATLGAPPPGPPLVPAEAPVAVPPPRPTRPDEPPGPPLPPNVVDVGGRSYLRVTVAAGPTVLHLAGRVVGGAWPAGRPAAEAGARAGLVAYDATELRLPVWTAYTLCGLRWTVMADHAAETGALLAHAVRGAAPGAGAYVCPVCAARVARPLPSRG